MARYTIGFVSVAAASGAAYAAFRAPTNDCRVLEIYLANNAATRSDVSLLRNTAAGYTATTSTSAGQAENPGSAAGTGLVDTVWSTPPTITAASRMRRFTLPATIGAGMIWVFQEGLWVKAATATSTIVLWNEGGSTGSVLNGHITWAE
jgi:hypothetical protein